MQIETSFKWKFERKNIFVDIKEMIVEIIKELDKMTEEEILDFYKEFNKERIEKGLAKSECANSLADRIIFFGLIRSMEKVHH